MKIVLDTNVFISGIFWEGNFCSQIIDLWRQGKVDLISSISMIDELIETLRTFKIQMEQEMIEEWRKLIIENSIIVEPFEKIEIIKEDPDDNKFLEAGVSGNAEYIISQDKHLLKIENYQKIKIISPEKFLDVIRESKNYT